MDEMIQRQGSYLKGTEFNNCHCSRCYYFSSYQLSISQQATLSLWSLLTWETYDTEARVWQAFQFIIHFKSPANKNDFTSMLPWHPSSLAWHMHYSGKKLIGNLYTGAWNENETRLKFIQQNSSQFKGSLDTCEDWLSAFQKNTNYM